MKISIPLRVMILCCIAFLLTLLPLPWIFIRFRPSWIVLLVLYVQMYLPQYFRLPWIFLLGLCMDVLSMTSLGEHAFAMGISIWVASIHSRRFHFFTMLQQMSLITAWCFLYQLAWYLINYFNGFHPDPWILLTTLLMNFLCWPMLRILCDRIFLSGKSMLYYSPSLKHRSPRF